MATLTPHQISGPKRSATATEARPDNPAYQAFWLLRIGLTVAPILFGLDKFSHVLVDWDQYLAPEIADLFNARAHTLMYFVGAIEITAGLVVAARPRVGGYLVAAWLGGIIVNLGMLADFYDVALRDFGLALAALTLARLATAFPVTPRPPVTIPAVPATATGDRGERPVVPLVPLAPLAPLASRPRRSGGSRP